jgi:hypothetical protein
MPSRCLVVVVKAAFTINEQSITPYCDEDLSTLSCACVFRWLGLEHDIKAIAILINKVPKISKCALIGSRFQSDVLCRQETPRAVKLL